MRNTDAPQSPAMAASAFEGAGPGFVDEREADRIEVEFRPKPVAAPLHDVRGLLSCYVQLAGRRR